MNRLISFLSILSAVVFLLAGCSTKPNVTTVSLGQEMSLAAGQTTEIHGEDITVKFIEITEDSRCPEGATCIWAGQASASVELTKDNVTYKMLLTEPGLSSDYTQTSFQQYTLVFRITPYPEVDKPIDDAGYRLALTINKT